MQMKLRMQHWSPHLTHTLHIVHLTHILHIVHLTHILHIVHLTHNLHCSIGHHTSHWTPHLTHFTLVHFTHNLHCSIGHHTSHIGLQTSHTILKQGATVVQWHSSTTIPFKSRLTFTNCMLSRLQTKSAIGRLWKFLPAIVRKWTDHTVPKTVQPLHCNRRASGDREGLIQTIPPLHRSFTNGD